MDAEFLGKQKMGVTANWDKEAPDDLGSDTLIRWVFDAEWEWDEFLRVREQSRNMIDTATTTVDLILDFRRTGALPSKSFIQGRDALQYSHPQLGTTIVISTNRLFKMIYRLINSMYPSLMKKRRVQLVDSLDAAYDAIRRERDVRETVHSDR